MGLTACVTLIYGTVFGPMNLFFETQNNISVVSGLESLKDCTKITLTKSDLESLIELTLKLKSLLLKNFKQDEKLTKVPFEVEDFNGFSPWSIKLLKNLPLKSSTVSKESNLYQEKREMLEEMKQILTYKFKNNGIESEQIQRESAYKSTDIAFRPADCTDLLVAGYTESGIYKINPFHCHCTRPVRVYCDMDTRGGGWTVFLSRMETSNQINFRRSWEEYKYFFGDAETEYWLGNEIIHIMSSSRDQMLLAEAKDSSGAYVWGQWDSFTVQSEKDGYKLLVSSYNKYSMGFEKLSENNDAKFTTFDVQEEKNKTCADKYKGGWWHNKCRTYNLTSAFVKGESRGIAVSPWSKADQSTHNAIWIQVKMRPKICKDPISKINLNKHNCIF